MLRKTILALAATAAIGTATLAPTSASAWGFHPGFHAGFFGWHGPAIRVYAGGPGYGGCMVRRWVATPFGPEVRWVNRCY